MQNMLLGAKDQPGENFFVAIVKPLWRKREREIEAKAEDLLAALQAATRRRTTTPAASRAASASCSRWPARS